MTPPPSSVLHPPSSFLHPLFSILRPPSSILHPPSFFLLSIAPHLHVNVPRFSQAGSPNVSFSGGSSCLPSPLMSWCIVSPGGPPRRQDERTAGTTRRASGRVPVL